MQPRFLAFWAINDRLDLPELLRQLDEMKRLGFDGFTWHPRFYTGEPEYLGPDYLRILSEVILRAKKLGMVVWIYDENGWPSGTASGETLRSHPELRQQWIELVTEPPADCLGSFVREGRTWFVSRRLGQGVDYLNPELARVFLSNTHERYRAGLDPEAFAHVSAFFCDEPEFGLGHAHDLISPHGALPWGPCVAEHFRSQHGVDPASRLEELFLGGPLRRLFIESLTDLFNRGFITPINDWCRSHGKEFTAHLKGEEHPLFQTVMAGSFHAFYRSLSLPGMDALERHPSGSFFPRQLSSAARQFGSGRCMAEAFGGAGWGASPEDLERYLLWLVHHGITDIVTHLWQFRFKSQAIHDWPASFPVHMTWREAFPELLRRVRTLAATLDRSIDTLLVAPYRRISEVYGVAEIKRANIHNGSHWPDTPASRLSLGFTALCERAESSGWRWHVSDERSLEDASRFEGGELVLGNMRYKRVVLGEGVCLEPAFHRLLEPLLVPAPAAVAEALVLSAAPSTAQVSAHWQVRRPASNRLALEAVKDAEGCFVACFEAEPGLELSTWFADSVTGLSVNGSASLSGAVFTSQQGRNMLRFRCGDEEPVLAVLGDFLVRSSAAWTPGPGGTQTTRGPFVLCRQLEPTPCDFLALGYPFLGSSLHAEAIIELDAGTKGLRLNAEADAARVRLDGIDLGWTWGPQWGIPMPQRLAAGSHRIEVELIPSTFNLYGPHHHVDGDRPVVSPVQYQYIRNFADRPDAPECTRVDAWHFRRFGLQATLQVLGA